MTRQNKIDNMEFFASMQVYDFSNLDLTESGDYNCFCNCDSDCNYSSDYSETNSSNNADSNCF